MHNVVSRSIEWGGRTLTLETGKFAQLANGAVRAQYGDTVILATAVLSSSIRPEVNYFPLSVDFEEKLYAAGKIKSSRFMKREGRPSDQAVLNARITDRTLRPLFDQRIRNDIQVVVTVLAVDQEQDPAMVGLIAAAAAVSVSDIPAEGPVMGLGVAHVGGEYVLNPTPEQRKEAQLYMFIAVRDGNIVMIEAEGVEAPEDVVEGALAYALEHSGPVLQLISDLQAEAGKEKVEPPVAEVTAEEQAMQEAVKAKALPYLEQNVPSIFGITSKQDRDDAEKTVKSGVKELFEESEEKSFAGHLFEEVYEEMFRQKMLKEGVRVDGRALDEVRPLYAEVDVLPRVHGSALFQRGETQVLSTVTLAGPGAALIVDGLTPEYKQRYMHHYNFPAYSVGEARPNRGPSRRDIGHGALAEKALESMIPDAEAFPYTMRVVSEVLMSNGSSSQASACGSTLALMAAGVPITNPVAGIAMGLVMTEDGQDYRVLTDIQGIEDHAGDMDFKVAGTEKGVTAIQLDIKLSGITLDICRDTLKQARDARLKILEVMKGAIAEPREEMSPYAPRIETIMIDPEKIGEIIGPGGKVINDIIDKTGVEIDIEDSGAVFITAVDGDGMKRAKAMIEAITREIEVGQVYKGRVTQIIKDRNSGGEIGAIVDIGGGKDGMVHISKVCAGRIDRVSDVLAEGDELLVKVTEVDKERGRISLSRRDALPQGEPDPKCEAAVAKSGGAQGQKSDREGGKPRPKGDKAGWKPYNKDQ